MLILVATDEEYQLAKCRWPRKRIIKTGVGGLNVIESLKKVNKRQKVINFGYVGSNNIPIGTEVEIGRCSLYHPNVDYCEPVYVLNGKTMCLTSDDFVLETKIKVPVVFDMELAYILALGFKKIKSIKIVSDNLSIDDYERNINNG